MLGAGPPDQEVSVNLKGFYGGRKTISIPLFSLQVDPECQSSKKIAVLQILFEEASNNNQCARARVRVRSGGLDLCPGPKMDHHSGGD